METKRDATMLVFVHIEKTAGTTIIWLLRSSFGIRHCDAEPWHARRTPIPFSPDDLQNLRKLYPWLRSLAGHRVVPYNNLESNCPSIQFFTFLRDPLERCASYFQYLVQTQGEDSRFEDWVQDEWPHNMQTKRIAGVEDATAAIELIHEKNIFVGLTEQFDKSLLLLQNFAHDLDISYEHKNVARDNSLAQSLLASESTRQMLIEINREDLELYQHVIQDLFPHYCREYGDTLAKDVAKYQHARSKLNHTNVLLNRIYRNLIYKPSLRLYRWRLQQGSHERHS